MIRLLAVVILFGLAGAGIWFLVAPVGIDLTAVATADWQVILIALFCFPLLVLLIGMLIVAVHPPAFRVGSHHYTGVELDEQGDQIIHAARGYLIAILEDLRSGQVAQPGMYSQKMFDALQQDISGLEAYRQRGWQFQFYWWHDESHQAFVRHVVSQNDIVCEFNGIFDYYFARGVERKRSPHESSTAPGFEREPATVRLRLMRQSEREAWLLAGFSEPFTDATIGYPTE